MSNLTISKRSWHYRLLNFCKEFSSGWTPDPTTLCEYFWSCVGYFLAAAGLFIMGTLLVVLTTIALPVLYWSWLMNGSLHSCVFALAITLGWVLAGLSIGYAAVKDYYRYRVKPKREEKPLTGLGVVVRYLVAIKRKMCPFITYVK